jgi:NADH:ubiquinone oxidoreductase subunit 3 (subunit A)
MTDLLLSPPSAFLVYILLAGLLSLFGRSLAGKGHPSEIKSSIYASGELASSDKAAPGYRQFFIIALFFAILHLGVLMLASGHLTTLSGIYLSGLIVSLVALILG